MINTIVTRPMPNVKQPANPLPIDLGPEQPFPYSMEEQRKILQEHNQWEHQQKHKAGQERRPTQRSGTDDRDYRPSQPQTRPADNPPRQLTPQSPHLTDCGNAIRLAERHGKDIRHCEPWKPKGWLV